MSETTSFTSLVSTPPRSLKVQVEITDAGEADNDNGGGLVARLMSCFDSGGASSEKEDVMQSITDYKNPLRYSKAPIYELETMVEAVDILKFAQSVIEDRNISLLLRSFHLWH